MNVQKWWICFSCLLLFCGLAMAQQQQPKKEQEDIPDAPSATRPVQPLPLPQSSPNEVPLPSDQVPLPSDQAPPSSSSQAPPEDKSLPFPEDAEPPHSPASTTTEPTTTTPPINLSTDTSDDTNKGGQDLGVFRMPTRVVNQVIIPVRVTDSSGQLENGLLPKDFRVFENGVQQKMNFFSISPFALSVAVIIDLGMPDVALQKVNQTFSSLQGAFSPFDEVAVYTYSSAVGEVSDFNGAGRRLGAVLDDLKTVRGHNDGIPVMGGPLGPQGPTINGVPADPSAPITRTPPKESHVLNDAILKAAFDLSRRDKARRKVIFIVSEGREYRSRASYRDVLKVLLSNDIMVYGIGTGSTAMPGYGTVAKLHVPLMGYSDILPKYAHATGGEVVNEYSRSAIEDAYSRVFGDARSQYTLGYITHPGANTVYRQIEVRVDRPDCSQYAPPCIKTYAKAGYYPLPPAQQGQK
jgi:VWFA-related protein